MWSLTRVAKGRDVAESHGRFTKRTLDLAVTNDRPFFLWDGQLKGLGARVDPSGTKTFVLRYRPKGYGARGPKRFITIGKFGVLTVDEARNRAREILGAVATGGDPAADLAQKRAASTFAEVADLFLKEHVESKRKSKTAIFYSSLLKSYAIPTLGSRKAEAVTRAEVARLHSQLAEKPYQANRLLAVIGSLYSFAQKRGLVPEDCNPARRIEKFPEQRRERFLSSDELERLGAAIRVGEIDGIPWTTESTKVASKHLPKTESQRTLISADAATALRLLIFTGARLREILDLQWEHVDLERGLLLLPDSKTGRKTIVLNRAALAILQGHPRRSPFVIPGDDLARPRSDLKRPWAAVCRHAGLVGLRIHDLRHTFASIGAGANMGLPIVGKLLGHSQPQTTARYAHLDVDPLVRAANVIGDHIQNAFDGKARLEGKTEGGR
jgi:integrase